VKSNASAYSLIFCDSVYYKSVLLYFKADAVLFRSKPESCGVNQILLKKNVPCSISTD